MKKGVIGLLLVVLGVAAFYYFGVYKTQEKVTPAPPPVVESTDVSEPEPEPAPLVVNQYVPPYSSEEPEAEPLPEPDPLPPLVESDALARDSVAELVGEATVMQYLVTENMISRFVASVDALTSSQIPEQLMVVSGPGGNFEATADDQPANVIRNAEGDAIPQFIMDPVNYQRYTRQVETFEAADAVELVGTFRELAPLFDQAWAELGYADGSFDDRLVEVIDSLLNSPDVRTPVHLIKPEAFYLLADPELESLPAGQKLLLRMGSANAARVKAKLLEIRGLLVDQV